MKLQRLILHNFRKFKNIDITFPEGIIGLVGNNGAGKSTIIEAIGWVIYGNRAARTSRDEVMRMGTSSNDDCWVKLIFDLEGDVYEVFRVFTGKTTDARVKINEKIAASSTQGVTEFLEKKLRMDYDAFYTSIVARQQELNALSDKSPAERKKSMLKMLNIDILDEIIRKVRDDRRQKEKFAEQLEPLLKDTVEMEQRRVTIEKKLAALKKEKETLELIIKEKIRDIENLKSERNSEKKRADTAKKISEQITLLKERRIHMQTSANEKQTNLNKLIEKTVEYERIASSVKEFQDFSKKREIMQHLKIQHSEHTNINQRISEIDTEIVALTSTITTLNHELANSHKIESDRNRTIEQIEKITDKFHDSEKLIETLTAEISFLNEAKKQAMTEAARITDLGPQSLCPTCGRELGDIYGELSKKFAQQIKMHEIELLKKQEELESLKQTINTFHTEQKTLTEQKQKLDEQIRKHELATERLVNIQERVKEKQIEKEKLTKRLAQIGVFEFDEQKFEELTEQLKKLASIKDRALVLQNELEKIPQIQQDLHGITKNIETVTDEINSQEYQLSALHYDENVFIELERRYNDNVATLTEKKEVQIRTEEKIEYEKREHSLIKEELTQQKLYHKQMLSLKQDIANFEALAGDRETGLLNNFKNHLISRIGPVLSHNASSFFSIVTEGKYQEIEIGDNYDINIYDNGEKFEITRFSGGEKDLANLSLRLAISQLIAQRADVLIQFIALDEIFGSQDKERRKNLLNALSELKNQFRQILLITHIDDIKDSVEYIITVSEDENGISNAYLE